LSNRRQHNRGRSASIDWPIGLTIVSRGEFSIILANLAQAGGLLPLIQPFAALYGLILAMIGPLLTKESERVYALATQGFHHKG
jgi:monovalent cation:H+ antiporter-2, CPA2 family